MLFCKWIQCHFSESFECFVSWLDSTLSLKSCYVLLCDWIQRFRWNHVMFCLVIRFDAFVEIMWCFVVIRFNAIIEIMWCFALWLDSALSLKSCDVLFRDWIQRYRCNHVMFRCDYIQRFRWNHVMFCFVIRFSAIVEIMLCFVLCFVLWLDSALSLKSCYVLLYD